MKTLTHELYDQGGNPIPGKLSVAYSWDVLMQDGGVYSSTPKVYYAADGVFSVPILAADDPGIEPGYEGFTTRVSWSAIAPDCNGRMAEGKVTSKTIQVVLADPEPVSIADLDNVTPATMGGVWYGQPGPTAVSADADNVATLGTDGLIYVSPADVGGFSDAAVAAFVDDTGSSTYASILAGFAATDDPRLSDARTPTAHTHDVGDIDATGTADSTTYLRGDGSWATPAGGGSAGAVDAVTLSTASQAITMPASPTVGDVLTLVVTAAGGTPAWDAAITWDAASAPTLSAVAGERDVLTFLYADPDWLGFVSGLFAPIPDIIVPSTPTNLSAIATSATVIDLTWTASTDNIGVTGYEYRIDGGAAVDAGVGTSESVTGLTASTLYSFEVRAYDAAGNRSGWSTPDSATTDAEVVVLSHEFRNSYVSTADTATYTFTAADLGVATEARRIIVGIGWRAASGASLTSVTVGGVSATVDVSNPVSINGGISGAAVVHAAVPTGTTGDIVVTLSSAAVRAGIGVWRATGPVTAADTDAPLTGVGTGTINGVAGGFVIATAFSTGVTTWTGVTEDYDHATGETDYYATGGSTTNTGAITWGTSKTTTAMGLAQAAVAYEGV